VRLYLVALSGFFLAAVATAQVGYRLPPGSVSVAGNLGNQCSPYVMDLGAHPYSPSGGTNFDLMESRYGPCFWSGTIGWHSSDAEAALRTICSLAPERGLNIGSRTALNPAFGCNPSKEEVSDLYYSRFKAKAVALAANLLLPPVPPPETPPVVEPPKTPPEPPAEPPYEFEELVQQAIDLLQRALAQHNGTASSVRLEMRLLDEQHLGFSEDGSRVLVAGEGLWDE